MTRFTVWRSSRSACLLTLMATGALADPAMDVRQNPAPAPKPTTVDGGAGKLELTHWADRRLMRNAVALWVDDQGAVYTAESERAGNATSDTRYTGRVPDNIEADVGLLSVDDRIAQEKEWEAKGYFPPGYFTKTADCVRKTEDADGDGVADGSRVLAKFQAHGDGICAGVIELGGSVYATCIPHLWRLTEGRDGDVKRESLSYGWGVRLAFFGHDMHGLVQGPDGRLYFSVGDRGFNVKTKEGVHYDMIGWDKPWDKQGNPKHVQGYCRGGVFRCWPDGSGMEMVFEGLRNPQGLAFNDMGQLFTGDNNSDVGGDPARFDYLPEYGDGGWRQDVQTFDKFAANDGTPYWRGPWLREKMPFLRDGRQAPADPHDPTTPAWQIPPVMLLGNGPAGMTHMPGTGHAARFNDDLLMVNYMPQLFAVKVEPRGATFSAKASVYFNCSRMTDAKWGPDGRLYVGLFGNTWTPGEGGEVLALRDPAVFADPVEKAAVDQVRQLLKEGMGGRKVGELLDLLGHRDQRVRQRAQNELARRDGVEPQLLAKAKDAGQAPLARVHALWTLWQKAAFAAAHGRKSAFALDAWEPLLADQDPVIRLQAARVLGDLRHPAPAAYIKLLKDGNAQARFYGALALGLTGEKSAIGPLFTMLKDSAGADPVLRHAASLALSRIADGGDGRRLVEAGRKGSVDERVGLVIALRRLRSPLSAQFLDDPDPQVAAEAARAIYDKAVVGAFPALADCLAQLRPQQKQEAFLRRAIEAAATLGRLRDAKALVALVGDSSIPLPHQKFALECLRDWDRPVARERVWGHMVRRPGHSAVWVQEVVAKSAGGLLKAAQAQKELASGVNAVLGRHLPPMTPDELVAKVADRSLDAGYRLAMLERLDREAGARVPAAARAFLAQVGDVGLRIRARELWAKEDSKGGAMVWFAAFQAGGLQERQAALHHLARLEDPAAREEMAWLWHQFEVGRLDPALGLDVVEALAGGGDPALAPQAKAYQSRQLTEPGMEGLPALRPHPLYLVGGDAAKGKAYFIDTPGGKSCASCHNAGTEKSWESFDPAHEPDGKGRGYPNLGLIGSRHAKDPMYLARAVFTPNADIAPGFSKPSAMPDGFAHELSPYEARDLLAFLQSRKMPEWGADVPVRREAAVPSGVTGIRLKVFLFMFGALFTLLGISGLGSWWLERGKPVLA